MIILDAPWIEDINKVKLLQIWTFFTFFVFWTKRVQSGLVCMVRMDRYDIRWYSLIFEKKAIYFIIVC